MIISLKVDSYCYCGQATANLKRDEGDISDKTEVQLYPTVVKPLNFDPYTPEELTQLEGQMCFAVRKLFEESFLNGID